MFCHLDLFFVCLSWRVCYFTGRSLRCSPGRGNAGHCAVMLYVGEGLRGNNGASSTLLWISIFHSATHSQTGPPLALVPEWVGLCTPRPLWVSPTISPVQLGVSPDAPPTPTGVFNQRFEALFPCAGALGCVVCFSPLPFLPECGAMGSASCSLACTIPQSATSLGPSPSMLL